MQRLAEAASKNIKIDDEAMYKVATMLAEKNAQSVSVAVHNIQICIINILAKLLVVYVPQDVAFAVIQYNVVNRYPNAYMIDNGESKKD
jgi:uncharacterized protein YigA (DUF484 family)